METVETFDYGITREWIDDGAVLLVTTQGNMADGAIDTWAELLLDSLARWPDAQPIFVLHDLSARSQGFTPYARQRTLELLNAIPDDRPCFNAVVLPRTFTNRVIRFFLRALRRPTGKQQEQVFVEYDDAYAWLQTMRQKYPLPHPAEWGSL